MDYSCGMGTLLSFFASQIPFSLFRPDLALVVSTTNIRCICTISSVYMTQSRGCIQEG